MLTSIGLIFLVGMACSAAAIRLRLPGLLGLIAAGALLGPYGLDLLSPALLLVAGDLRQLALVVILIRAGLGLDCRALRQVGRPALLLCFVPALFEIAGYLLLAPALLDMPLLEAALMGAALAAVSPAVIVPRMLRLQQEGWGVAKGIPQMIMAGASVDDVLVIVLFTAFTGMAAGGGGLSAAALAQVPLSMVLGALGGAVCGVVLQKLFKAVHMRDSVKVVLLLGVSFLLVGAEAYLPFSGLLAVMAAGMALRGLYPVLAGRLSAKFSKLWVAAEVLLFVLVGAAVDMGYALRAGWAPVLLIALALLLRSAGVLLCVAATGLRAKERLFCVVAYLPKATVQAAIGPVPLAMGLACGPLVLTVAVLAILITAPLGAVGIDLGYSRWLERQG